MSSPRLPSLLTALGLSSRAPKSPPPPEAAEKSPTLLCRLCDTLYPTEASFASFSRASGSGWCISCARAKGDFDVKPFNKSAKNPFKTF